MWVVTDETGGKSTDSAQHVLTVLQTHLLISQATIFWGEYPDRLVKTLQVTSIKWNNFYWALLCYTIGPAIQNLQTIQNPGRFFCFEILQY